MINEQSDARRKPEDVSSRPLKGLKSPKPATVMEEKEPEKKSAQDESAETDEHI